MKDLGVLETIFRETMSLQLMRESAMISDDSEKTKAQLQQEMRDLQSKIAQIEPRTSKHVSVLASSPIPKKQRLKY